jgi:hypothetical protein
VLWQPYRQASAADDMMRSATVAPSPAAAEGTYRDVIQRFPGTPQASEAMLHLATLLTARGEHGAALQLLDRAALDSTTRARVPLMRAVVQFERGDTTAACTALDAARRTTLPADLDGRRQIDLYTPRCVPADSAVGAAAVAPANGTAPVGPPVRPDSGDTTRAPSRGAPMEST